MNERESLIAIGLILWGSDWPARMARALGVDGELVDAWRKGSAKPARYVLVRPQRLAQQRVAAVATARAMKRPGTRGLF